MNTEQFQIIEALSSNINTELTINQISKKIKKSYAFTNKYTHELINQGVLSKKVIGPSILCNLNYDNEETIASLVYISMKKASNIEHSLTKKLKDSDILLLVNKKKVLVGKKNRTSFFQNINNIDLSKTTILKGHEMFWRNVQKVKS